MEETGGGEEWGEEWDGEWYDENGQLVTSIEEPSEGEDSCNHSTSSSFAETAPEDSVSVRTRIAMEVLETEQTYVGNIHYVIENYLKPIKSRMDTPSQVLKPTAFEKVFGNLENVYQVNLKFLKLLEERINHSFDPESTTISDIFLQCIPTFGPAYKPYLERHQQTIDKLRVLDKRSSWLTFLQEVREKPDSKKGELSFFLIQPVQRCPRYELLLNQLIKHTPTTHPDFKGLNKALEDSQELVISANEEMRKHAELEILHKIAGKWSDVPKTFKIAELGRKKLKEGTLQKICKKETKKRFFILFNDMLLYGGHQASGGYKYSLHIDLTNSKTRLQNLQDKGDLKNAFVVRSPEKSFTVYAESPQEKQSWVSSIDAILTAGGTVPPKKPKSGSFLNSNGKEEVAVVIESSDIDSEEAPLWIPDKDFNFCMICAIGFTLIRRKHHCRICGKLICGNCSAQKAVLSKTHKESAVRICKICHGIKQLRQAAATPPKEDSPVVASSLAPPPATRKSFSTPTGLGGFNYLGGSNSPKSPPPLVRSSDSDLPPKSSSFIGLSPPASNSSSNSSDEKMEKKKKPFFSKKGSKKDFKESNDSSSPSSSFIQSSPQLLVVKELSTSSPKITASTSSSLVSASPASSTGGLSPNLNPNMKMHALPPGGLAALKSYSTSNLNNVSSNPVKRSTTATSALANKMMATNLSTASNQNNQNNNGNGKTASAPEPSNATVHNEETRGRRVGPTVQPTAAAMGGSLRQQNTLLGSGRPLPTPGSRSPSHTLTSSDPSDPRPQVTRSATTSTFRPLPQVPTI